MSVEIKKDGPVGVGPKKEMKPEMSNPGMGHQPFVPRGGRGGNFGGRGAGRGGRGGRGGFNNPQQGFSRDSPAPGGLRGNSFVFRV
jgi:hypothetical protein